MPVQFLLAIAMNNMVKLIIIVGVVAVLSVLGWKYYEIVVSRSTHSVNSSPDGTSNANSDLRRNVSTEEGPLSEGEIQMRELQRYKSMSHDTIEDKVAAVAACVYFRNHVHAEAIPLLIKNINLNNYPFDPERMNHPTLDSAFRGPSIDQVFPAVHALKAYGVDGADAIVDELIKDENFDRYAEPYNLLLEVFFCILPREQLRAEVESHLNTLSLTLYQQDKYNNLFKSILQ